MLAACRSGHPSRVLAPLLLAAALATGCQTTVGNYLANRGRDFGECFMVQVGYDAGLGVHIKGAGVVHACALAPAVPQGQSIGWVYGSLRPPTAYSELGGEQDPLDGDAGTVFFPLWGWGWITHGDSLEHSCWTLLPAVLAKQGKLDQREEDGGRWLWDPREDDAPEFRWARVHAFDVEVGAALLLFARAGFSPGEFLDFLLGWVGVDIAGDDRSVAPEETPPGSK